MLAAPTYLSSKLLSLLCRMSPVLFISHVYCLCYCLCLLFTVYCCPGQAAGSGQLHVCSGCVPTGDCLSRLSGLTGVKLPSLGREAGPGARDFSPGHSGAASEVTRRERRDSACVGDHDMTDTRTRTSSDIQINERTRGQD